MLRIFTRVLSHLVHLWTKIKMSWLCRWPLASSSSKAQTHGRLKCWNLNLLHISYHAKRFMHCLNVVPFSLSYIFFNFMYVNELMFFRHSKTLRPKMFFGRMVYIACSSSKWPKVNCVTCVSFKHSNTKKQHQNTEK